MYAVTPFSRWWLSEVFHLAKNQIGTVLAQSDYRKTESPYGVRFWSDFW
jgi:hypothetical protein